MNIQIAHIQHKSAAEIRSSAAAVRGRLFAPQARFEDADALPAPRPQKPVTDKPWWKTNDIRFDAHVLDWQMQQFKQATTVRSFIKARCAEIGVSYDDLRGPSRMRKIVMIRHQLMFEVWEKFEPSYPELARYFGRSDHSSAIYVIRKMKAIKAGTYKSKMVEDFDLKTLRQHFVEGLSTYEIARRSNISQTTVCRVIKRHKWKRQDA